MLSLLVMRLAVGRTPLGRLRDATDVARYVRDRDQQRWRRCLGSNPLAPTIPITSCVGNNPAFISAWPISQAFSFG